MRTSTPPVLLTALVLAAFARAEEVNDRRKTLDTDGIKVCAACLDDYLIVPRYQLNCGNSRGMTSGDIRKKYAMEYAWRQNGKMERRSAPPDEVEVHAANALPTLDPGDYGWLHSVEVVAVTGKNDMLVKNLWLADPKWEEADLKKLAAKLARAQEVVKKEYGAKIQTIEKNKIAFENWSLSAPRSGDPSVQANAINNQREEFNAQIRELGRQRDAAIADLTPNKAELLKMTKLHGKAQLEAIQRQDILGKDLNQTFRLTGFSTAKVRPNDRFTGLNGDGLQVAVAWKDKSGERVLAAVSLLKTPLDQAGLRELLAKRKTSAEDFNQQMAAAKQGKIGPAAIQAAQQAMSRWVRNSDD